MRGRRPGPPRLKLLRGNPGKRSVPAPAASPPPGAACPTWLSEQAKAEWKRLHAELLRLGTLTTLDRACFAAYCEAVSDFAWAVQELEREGYTATSCNGTVFLHPAFQIKSIAMKQIRAFAAEFGFSPSTRGRVDMPGSGGEDPESARFFGPKPAPRPEKDPA